MSFRRTILKRLEYAFEKRKHERDEARCDLFKFIYLNNVAIV